MNLLSQTKDALLHILYPRTCAGCGKDILPEQSQICVQCLHQLPLTHFEKQANNPIEKILAGRVHFQKATAQLYFHKHAALQQMIHQFKYKGKKEVGLQLGILMGNQLMKSGRFNDIEALIPLPLHESKKRIRGYNQAEVLCNGISEILNIPVVTNVIAKPIATETQTKKNRVQRWQNIEGKFKVVNNTSLMHKQVLLVDDVITTGATIESCAGALLNIDGLKLNIATLCCALHV